MNTIEGYTPIYKLSIQQYYIEEEVLENQISWNAHHTEFLSKSRIVIMLMYREYGGIYEEITRVPHHHCRLSLKF